MDALSVVLSGVRLRGAMLDDYVISAPNAALPVSLFTVTLLDDQLFIDFDGKGHFPLIPLSETEFSLGGSFEFVVNDGSVATALIWHTIERDQKAVRTSENTRARPR